MSFCRLINTPEVIEGSLDLVKMGVLSSTHAFVFGAQKRLFIGLPRLQYGQLLGRPDVVRFDDIHGGFEYTPTVAFRTVQVILPSHDLLLLAFILLSWNGYIIAID